MQNGKQINGGNGVGNNEIRSYIENYQKNITSIILNVIKMKEKPTYSIEIGVYPGILFGIRTYDEPEQISFVGYIPFIDFCITFYKG